MKKSNLVVLLLIFLAAGAYTLYNRPEAKTDPVANNTEMSDNEKASETNVAEYAYSGKLLDVTKGKVVQKVLTKGESTGTAEATFADGKYNLVANFEGLQDPYGTDFYEGWVVRKGVKFSVISTGKATKVDGKYQNTFTSNKDLTDHDFYVLTIEPDDGDPAPAGHILEGTLTK